MTVLLDVNVLTALVDSAHVHHEAAEKWFASQEDDFATCPVTEGGLVRFLLREGQSAQTAQALVIALTESERHEFWPDAVPYKAVRMDGVVGHRQVTDAYLAQLARSRQVRLATFDTGLAQLHHDVADLVRP